jgi:membrane protein DedA with SNARE-associated domain
VVLASISATLTDFVGNHGLYAVFLLMLVDAVFPAASELVMVYAGALAAGAFAHHVGGFGAGVDAYIAIALAGTLGYLVGAWIGWWIGLRGGRPLVARHGKWLHLNEEKLDRAERWFARWEDWGVFFGRLTPVVRSFVSIPAGVFEVRFWRYTWLTLLGSAIWAFALAGVGYGLGSSYEKFHHAFRFADYLVAAALGAAVAYAILRRRKASRGSTLKRRGDTTR